MKYLWYDWFMTILFPLISYLCMFIHGSMAESRTMTNDETYMEYDSMAESQWFRIWLNGWVKVVYDMTQWLSQSSLWYDSMDESMYRLGKWLNGWVRMSRNDSGDDSVHDLGNDLYYDLEWLEMT